MSKWTLEYIRRLCRVDADCLIYTGAINTKRHPKIEKRSGRRVVWELSCGPIPSGMFVSLTCENPACLNPEHMRLRSRGEISREVLSRPTVQLKRSASGAKSMIHRAKLDMETARYIRSSNQPQTHLARELGISQQLVSRVRLGKAWREHSNNPFAGLM